MIRILILFIFNIFLIAKTEYQTNIISQDKNFVYVEDNELIKLNSSAVIIKNIQDADVIVARANVVEKKEQVVKLEITKFDDLKHNLMPDIEVKIENNDKVLFNYLYDRAFIIAPNKLVYENIAKSYSNIVFFDTNLLSAKFIKKKKAYPSENGIKSFCDFYSLGTIYYANFSKLYVIDCRNFHTIESYDLALEEEKRVNFIYSSLVKEVDYKEYKNYYNNLFNILE